MRDIDLRLNLRLAHALLDLIERDPILFDTDLSQLPWPINRWGRLRVRVHP